MITKRLEELGKAQECSFVRMQVWNERQSIISHLGARNEA